MNHHFVTTLRDEGSHDSGFSDVSKTRGEIFISISSEHATKATFLLKLDVAHFRDATNDCLHYQLIC